MDSKQHIIDICIRYKDGEFSKQMFKVYFECAQNYILYDIVTKKLDVAEYILYASALVQSAIIL